MDNKQNFEWTDALKAECLDYLMQQFITNGWAGFGSELEFFKHLKSKEHKVEEKRIEVTVHELVNSQKILYGFAFHTPIISAEKYEAVKQAIERELNNEPLSDSIPTLERQYYVPLAEGGKCPKIPLTPPQESKQDSKGYEIITMRLRNNIMPYILNTVFSEPWEINSVRRLSDGEVFSVGEEVSTNRNRGKHKIDAFSIIDGDMCVVMSTFPTGNEFLYVISKLPPPLTEQPKQVLFTTEDGVEVHYNDNCWIVENGNDMPFQWIKCCKEGMSEKYKYFSTKEAAVQYILDNKPCLSLKEVKDYWSKHYCGDFMVADFAENITALAKNKIKNTTPLNKEHK